MSIRDLRTVMLAQPRAFSTAEVLNHTQWPTLTGALRRGEIVRVLPGLYAAGIHANSWVVRMDACRHWIPDGVITGPSALRYLGLRSLPGDHVHVVTRRPEHRRLPSWLRVRRSDVHVPTLELGGLRVHEPAFALAVGHGMVPLRDRAELVHAPFREGLVTAAALAAALAYLPRVVARRALAARAALATDGIESFLEERAWATVMRGPVCHRFVRQHTLTVQGKTFRLDAFDPATHTAVEFDGAAWHSGERVHGDARRDALLATVGVLTLRLGYQEVMSEPQRCRELIEEVVAQRTNSR